MHKDLLDKLNQLTQSLAVPSGDTGITAKAVSDILSNLSALQQLAVDGSVLRTTGIGLTIQKIKKDKALPPQIREAAAALREAWGDQVQR